MSSPRREQPEEKYSEAEIKLWIELEKVRQETARYTGDKIYQAFSELCKVLRDLADTYKEYTLKKTLRLTAPLYFLMTVVFIGGTALTLLEKISGEANGSSNRNNSGIYHYSNL